MGRSQKVWAAVVASLAVLAAGAGPAPASGPPTAVTGEAVVFNPTTVLLTGQVNPNGSATTYYFEYGPSIEYGTSIPVPSKSAGGGTTTVSVGDVLSELKPDEYHFRLVAASAHGTTYGNDETFDTSYGEPMEVVDSTNYSPCSEVTVEGSQVSGGCLSENWEGSWTLFQFGAPVVYGCETSFDMRVDSQGGFQTFNNYIGGCDGFQRIACGNVPWPGRLVLVEPGRYEAEVEMCITSPGNPSSQAWATVTMDVQLEDDIPFTLAGRSSIPGGLGEIEASYESSEAGVSLIEL